ncbi:MULTISPECIES: TIGR03943 family putative permease subunit [Streptomyces]|uniref:TIGR03943 family putative permease subunit n=1 Tax=Streptomyces TaxID=1883 RepID=UPI001424BB8A|nr:TIGR03943 family protein [Streptomyces sp. AgN23]AJZ84436.1 TIGR03943 family protein [Streptomyces sp. AgN23]WTA79141.1 TIGR03943 family protein [Streptomyces antimycoticus]WTB10528.1 TIGR03943 family protein [Streptomyces antimycoticus]
MNRKAQAIVLFLIGGAVLRAGFTGLYLRYVKAGLRPLLLAAGVVLIAAAVATIWYERPRRAHADPYAEEGDGGHAHREPRVSWLLVLPLFALILVAPPALGSYTAMHTGTALQRPWGFPALPAGDPLPLNVADYAGRAVYDHGRSLEHRRIEVTGFVALDGHGAPYLVRMALNCCAADAQPVKIGLTGRIPPVLQPDTWLQVIGTYTRKRTTDPVGGGAIPYLEVSSSRPVPAPRDPYDESWNG